jgi:hypothetical protein
MKRIRGLAVLSSAVALGLACGDSTAPLCPSLPLTVSVTSSTTPTFTWTPNCSADQLVVYEVIQPSAGPDQPVWIIKARTWGVGTASPVVYGHVTLSMRQTTGPEPLVVGRTYRVSVLNASRVEMGSRIFGP